MFKLQTKPSKGRKANDVAKFDVDKEQFKPIDLIVDALIGYLEQSTPLMRAISGQVFSALCSKVEHSTMDLLLKVGLASDVAFFVHSSICVLCFPFSKFRGEAYSPTIHRKRGTKVWRRMVRRVRRG